MNDLDQLKNWVGPLLAKLSQQERRKLTSTIARDLRRSQQQRIRQQQNPDGTPYTPRKQTQRSKRGNIKRRAMFSKIRLARYLTLNSTSDQIAIAFRGRIANIARVHQYGLRDKPDRKSRDVQYAKRELLGFTEQEVRVIEERLINYWG